MFKIMAEQCSECLFSKDRIVSSARASEILRECKERDTHFICHKATILGEEACCRAFYNIDPGGTNLLRVMGRLGAVVFVDEDMNPVADQSPEFAAKTPPASSPDSVKSEIETLQKDPKDTSREAAR